MNASPLPLVGFDMSPRARSWIVVAAIGMLAAMPAAAAVCELQCAAARPAPVAVDENPKASGACPFHEGSRAADDLGATPDGRCAGGGHSPAGAVLVAGSSPAGSVSFGPAGVLAAAFLAEGHDGTFDRAHRLSPSVGRSPGAPALCAILRV